MFDPYSQWLGLPAGTDPPNHYELLDIDPNEDDPEVIEEAANQQILRLKSHRKGPRAEECSQLVSEIAEARDTLLDPAARKVYDSKLGKAPAAKSTATTAAPKKEKVSPGGDAKKGKSKHKQPEPKKGNGLLLVLGGGLALLLFVCAGGGVAAYFLFFKSKDQTSPGPVAVAPQIQPVNPATRPEEPIVPPTKPDDPTPTKPDDPTPTKSTDPTPAKPAETPPPPPPPPMPAPAPRVKLLVPNDSDLARAEKVHKDNYKADYAKIKSDSKPEEYLPLAAKFLVPGRENRGDPAEWFLLLREARDLAVKAEHPRLAVEAVREIDEWFVIDPLMMTQKVLSDFGKSTNDIAIKTLALLALGESRRALAEQKFDAAASFLKVAEDATGKVSDKDKGVLTDRIQLRRAEIQDAKTNFPAVEAARAKLKATPEDPEANAVVGKHLCLACGKWDEGLPLLAKGNDAALKALAEKDLKRPIEGPALIAVADGWFDLAYELAEKPGGRPKTPLLVRAKYWYDRVEPSASADVQSRVGKRMGHIVTAVPTTVPRIAPGSFLSRVSVEDRTLLLREGGGNLKSEEAIDQGLKWLVEHQFPNGHWATDLFHKAPKCKDKCSEWATEGKHDIAGTAFGLLPFLGAGETHQRGAYRASVKKGIEFLLAKQNKDGAFDGNMYEHGLATIAICEAYGLTRDPGLRAPALYALNYIVKGQDPGGSWGYSANTKGDLSVSGWQFTALKTGHFAGLPVGVTPFTKLGKFLDSVADTGGAGYGYNAPGAAKATSAVGLLCREFLGWSVYSPDMAKAVDNLIAQEDPATVAKDQFGIYYIYYATQLLHHHGGPKWQTWNYKVRDRLLELQDKGDDVGYSHQKGSWSPYKDQWEKQGGRLMYTSFALLTLETYYHHVPLNGYGRAVLDE